MIINFDLRGKNVVVIGGGREALKRVMHMMGEECKITVISDATNPEIDRLAEKGKIALRRKKIRDVEFFAQCRPDLVVTTTDNHMLNQKIIAHAKKRRIIAYSSDDPESSDYANLMVIDVKNTVKIAVFTGGKSPAIAKKIGTRIRKNVSNIVSSEDVGHIRIQNVARRLAREKIVSQSERRAFLAALTCDEKIKQLIKDGCLKKAEDRAAAMLMDWK